LIIQAHVKDGVEMAKRHRLPKAIIDFIPQHHGTALIEYFYEKAKKEAPEGKEVDENRYRYGGPKPQTKETGILMLADSVEAASRTLSDPSPAKIKGLVQKMINKIFSSGELEECELTLKDLHQIAKSFTRVLSGIHHRRIEYSEPAEKRARPSETKSVVDDTDAGEAAAARKQDEAKEPQKNGRRSGSEGNGATSPREGVSEKDNGQRPREALRRLGM
ncbi:MAG: HD domain-containing protein, partial [Bdellovibrionales bacterium]|nr:HD domain-containing protein [Bdellovibrionales bacterium]